MIKLKEIAVFRAGYPFRGRIEEIPGAGVRVIQMKDVDPSKGISWSGLSETELTGRKQPDLLNPEDILFLARGFRNFAVQLDKITGSVVASPHFFHITLKPESNILPAFLAWQINQVPAQQHLKTSALGTSIPSIRRAELAELPIAIPPIEKQRQVVALEQAWQREQEVIANLKNNMKQTMTGLAQQLLRVH